MGLYSDYKRLKYGTAQEVTTQSGGLRARWAARAAESSALAPVQEEPKIIQPSVSVPTIKQPASAASAAPLYGPSVQAPGLTLKLPRTDLPYANNPVQSAGSDLVKRVLSGTGGNVLADASKAAAPAMQKAGKTGTSVFGTIGGALNEGVANTAKGIATIGNLMATESAASERAHRSAGIDDTMPLTRRQMERYNAIAANDESIQKQAADARAKGAERQKKINETASTATAAIRDASGADPEKMGTAARIAHGTIASLPQMLAGLPVFVASAAGNYAADALDEGATNGQALAYGLASGAVEVGLERVLGVVPGIKGLKQAATAGVKGFVKNIGGEALEEAVTTPVTDALKKIMYNPNQRVFTTDSLRQAGEDAAGGAMMAILVTALGMPLGSVSRSMAEKQVASGKQLTPEKASAIHGVTMAESDVQTEAEKASEKAQEAFSGKNEPTPIINTAIPLYNGKLKEAIADFEEALKYEYGDDAIGGTADTISDRVSKDEAEDLRKLYSMRDGDWQKNAAAQQAAQTAPASTDEALDIYDGTVSPGKAYSPEQIARYADGRDKLPDDLVALQQLADEVDALKQNPGPVRMNLQFFGDTVREKIKINLLEQHKLVKQTKKAYENAYARASFTDKELLILADLKRGIKTKEEIPFDMNFEALGEVYDAWSKYQTARGVIDAHKTAMREKRYKQAEDIIAESDSFKDKKSVMAYSAETMERNNRDVMGELDAQRVNEAYFRPIHENEAKAQRWLNKYRNKVKALKLSKEESALVQLLGEGKIQASDIVPGTSIRYQRTDTKQDVYFPVPQGTTQKRIVDAVNTFRSIYDEIFAQHNDVMMYNGYNPGDYRKDYFPHFEAETDPALNFLKSIGFDISGVDLPTDIAGLTENRKPGTKWFGNMQQRLRKNTNTYDAIEGFERYITGAKDRIWHTSDVQRLRALELVMRQKYSPENITKEIKSLKSDMTLDADDRDDRIAELLNRDPGHMPNYVRNLREYTDMLAGKRHSFDRKIQDAIGTKRYVVLRELMNRTAKNMVAINPGSWLTNFISLIQGSSFIPAKDVMEATSATIRAVTIDDGFANRSTFLTNRRGSEALNKTKLQTFTDTASAPMRIIDDFSANILVRGKYLEQIRNGKTPKEAMRAADAFAASVMADRSKGAIPNRFAQTNPVTKLFTQFQLEVKNQLSFLLKDVPNYGRDEGSKKLATALFKFIVGSWLYNMLMENMIGRKPALDPFGTLIQAWEDLDNPDALVANLTDNTIGQLPFVGGIASNIIGQGQGGRLPVNAAIPDLKYVSQGVTDIVGGDAPAGLKTIGKEMLKPATYLLPPVGGGQIKKTAEGFGAFVRGESTTASGAMRYPIPQTFGNFVKTGVFGQYSTKGGREYFDENRRPLSEAQSKQVRESDDPQATYDKIIKQRKIDKINAQLKAARKATLMPDDERARLIERLTAELKKLRNG